MNTDFFLERYNKLNPEQKKAVETIDGPVLVIAGPGSGKTEILSLRVANILRKTDTPASSVLCLTFTEAAALNMRSRLSTIISRDAYRVGIHTFHGFCTDVISRYPEYFFGHADFHPADDVTQLEILGTLFRLMEHDNPLRSEHPDQGFVFLKPSMKSISDLKKAGISPDEFKKILDRNDVVLQKLNPLLATHMPDRIAKKEIGTFRDLYEAIQKVSCPANPVPHVRCLRDVLAESLLVAVTEAEEEDKTQTLTEWKKSVIAKIEDGDSEIFVFKDTERLPKMRALADLYTAFQTQMYEEGYFDFDDMILETVKAIEENADLALELQESFQYILVDEFQDTNGAQMKLLLAITSSFVHEGRPNIMAVGDDDQAIYKFQGAEIANILSFTRHFENPAIIALKTNYRSTKEILAVSEGVIKQSTQSLRALMPEIQKEIVPASQEKVGKVVCKSFTTTLDEYDFVAREIRGLLDTGVAPDSIAVIARTHDDLGQLMSYARLHNVPVRYEKQRNVLEDILVRQLLTMIRFVDTLNAFRVTEADEYMPEILAFPFWNISRRVIWDISVEVNKRGRMEHESANGLWIQTMLDHDDLYIRSIAEFLLFVAVEAKTLPLERIMDILIGSTVLSIPEDAHEDGDADEEDPFLDTQTETNIQIKKDRAPLVSPFRDFYFNSDRFVSNKTEYISFLSSLKVFIGALREYRQGRVLTVADCITFIGVYEKNNLPLLDESPFISAEAAVHFLTGHKAKGLEYDTVFVLSANTNVWSKSTHVDKLPFPKNIIARPSADSVDDKMRLFYVALTRARENLYITYYEKDEKGKDGSLVEFLTSMQDMFVTGEAPEDGKGSVSNLETHVFSLIAAPYVSDERAVLAELVKEYAMPVTHLNNFLDVSRGGPQVFLEQNLLRFPQAKTVSSVYGTAIHGVVEYIYTYLKRETELPPLKNVYTHFEKLIRLGKLHPADETIQITRGKKVIELLLKEKKDDFHITDKIEVDFKNQGVCVGDDGVHITGKIDRMRIDGSHVLVTDWKTGKAKTSWDGKEMHEKIQLHGYKRQVLFYKLLVEESKDYKQYTVEEGRLSFLEPVRSGASGTKSQFVDLPLIIDPADIERLKKLITVVHTKIVNLDFPDISKYSPDLKGILAFEDDLLEGKV